MSNDARAWRGGGGRGPKTFARRVANYLQSHPHWLLLSGCFAGLFLAYFAIFSITAATPFTQDLRDALNNSLSASVLAGLASILIHRFLLGRRLATQIVGHGALALAFAILWYITIITAYAFFRGAFAEGAKIKPFIPVVIGWQIFQGMVLYSAVAAASIALEMRRRMIAAEDRADRAEQIATAHAGAVPTRLIRGEDGYLPLEIDEIVAVRGSDDYSEVITLRGRTLVRRSLAKLEADLPSGRFLRVHRSWIVNLDRLVRAEPAGNGRLQLFLSNGEPIIASRTGTRLLRARVV